AADLYEESYRLRDGAGDVLGAVMALNNLGEIRSDQRRFDEARRFFDDALRRGKAANTTLLIHVLEANRGRLATRLGEFDDAEALLDTALAGFTEIDSASFIVDTELRRVELLAARERWPEAEREASRLLLAAAERKAGAAETVPLMRIRAAAAAAAGDRDGAVELLREALRTAEEGGIRYQRASTLMELSAFEPDAGHRTGAIELFQALGVNLEQLV
ncbi:MAG: tetratricopeptide repeat protein, partial [Acidimicrobiales bacterium]